MYLNVAKVNYEEELITVIKLGAKRLAQAAVCHNPSDMFEVR
jgi:hypothetical protein